VKIGSGPRTNNIFGDDKTMRPDYDATARWPANLVLDDVAAAMLDAQSGITTSGAMRREVDAYEGQSNTSFLRGRSGPSNQHGDTGGASRFFAIFQRTMEEDDLRFFYTAKASKSERGDDNTHPTVKPVALMAWLCRLVTPPGGIVLDPFCGSGSTLLAAIEEGFRPTGIELESEYVEIIIKRLERALAQGNLFRNP
jgi:site-specific DNA-methyltransferase (adenine-specific)